jgi:hypothetical protein
MTGLQSAVVICTAVFESASLVGVDKTRSQRSHYNYAANNTEKANTRAAMARLVFISQFGACTEHVHRKCGFISQTPNTTCWLAGPHKMTPEHGF